MNVKKSGVPHQRGGDSSRGGGAQGLVFGLGQCSLDYLGRIESWPVPDSKCELKNLKVEFDDHVEVR